MINEKMFALGDAPNKIREIYAYGLERKAAIGEDKVFDLSIGNPSVPSPPQIDETIAKLAEESDGTIHKYTPSPGLEWVRKAIADNLNKRFGKHYTADNLYLTSGASSALAICLKAVALPGEDVIVNTPYFPEYRTWTENAGAVCREVPTRVSDFQLDIDALREAINDKTAAIIINSPNNPVGAVYTKENLTELAALLTERSKQYGHPIYLISDEPYRELVYGSAEVSWVPDLYDATFVCYSWSKSFSLPGERIGYVLVPDTMPDCEHVYKAVCGGGRTLGYICDSTLFQTVIATCVDAQVNVRPYAVNRQLLTEGLDKIGYTYVEPDGAFYLWIKALEDDAEAFCEHAKKYELLLVPSTCFGTPGWVRVGYCASEQTIRGSLGAFKALYEDYR
jgi:aspartate aminotransferase